MQGLLLVLDLRRDTLDTLDTQDNATCDIQYEVMITHTSALMYATVHETTDLARALHSQHSRTRLSALSRLRKRCARSYRTCRVRSCQEGSKGDVICCFCKQVCDRPFMTEETVAIKASAPCRRPLHASNVSMEAEPKSQTSMSA